MMSLSKVLAATVAAALVSGCGASSISEGPGGATQLVSSSASSQGSALGTDAPKLVTAPAPRMRARLATRTSRRL